MRRSEQMKQIGINIAKERKKANFTQQQLADKIKVSRTHLSNVEAQGMFTRPSLELLLDISEALGISVKDLL